MNVLIAGGGRGSWEVRGRQLGAAIGARVCRQPSDGDLAWADVVVLVKRALSTFADRVHQAGKPLVWDALDFWQQPEQNSLTPEASLDLLRTTVARYRPTLVIGATEAMAEAAGGIYLPHHARPSLTPGPVRTDVRTVAYEGTRKYLGRWGRALTKACERRGWSLVINPPDLRDADLVVAFRDGTWDGWMCQEWKSGVKVVNAMMAGRPIIGQPSAAMRELRPVGAVVETIEELEKAFDICRSATNRQIFADDAARRASRFTLTAIASQYLTILETATRSKAA